MMLIVDMAKLSQADLRKSIGDRCSDFGHATVLKVLRPEGPSDFGAAAVEMSDLEEAEHLAREFSGSRCGCKVIIRLVQAGQAMPSAFKRHHSPFAPISGIHTPQP